MFKKLSFKKNYSNLTHNRGGTGKSAYDIAREAGFEGTREQWLDTLGKKPTVKI